MKKLLSTLLIGVLCLCLVFALAACNTAESTDADVSSEGSSSVPAKPTIVGKWQSDINITELLSKSEDPSVRAMIAYLSEKPIVVSVTLDFKEDGTCGGSIDAGSAVVAIQSLIAALEEHNSDLVGLLFENLDLDAIFGGSEGAAEGEGALGFEINEDSIREMINSVINKIKELDPADAKQTAEGGEYRYEDGKLYCVELDGELDEKSYITCTLTADTLTVTGFESESELIGGIGLPEFEMPELKIEFKKVATE